MGSHHFFYFCAVSVACRRTTETHICQHTWAWVLFNQTPCSQTRQLQAYPVALTTGHMKVFDTQYISLICWGCEGRCWLLLKWAASYSIMNGVWQQPAGIIWRLWSAHQVSEFWGYPWHLGPSRSPQRETWSFLPQNPGGRTNIPRWLIR